MYTRPSVTLPIVTITPLPALLGAYAADEQVTQLNRRITAQFIMKAVATPGTFLVNSRVYLSDLQVFINFTVEKEEKLQKPVRVVPHGDKASKASEFLNDS